MILPLQIFLGDVLDELLHARSDRQHCRSTGLAFFAMSKSASSPPTSCQLIQLGFTFVLQTVWVSESF